MEWNQSELLYVINDMKIDPEVIENKIIRV